jgi:hypothetical protein
MSKTLAFIGACVGLAIVAAFGSQWPSSRQSG